VDAVTLRIGTNDPADAPDVPQMLDEFAQRVAELSAGSMVVEPVWRAAGDPAPDDWDQAVAHKIVDGELDMGLIPAGAWDVMGVTTLRALNAPFLVDSDTLVGDVASGDLASDLLVGLDEVGVTGLALIPEGLRHVFSFGDPLLAPDDFAGTSIRSPRSDTVYALFEALGAAANDVQGSEFDTAVQDGSLAGAESSYSRAGGLPGSQQSVVGNLPLFPKVEALVVNSARFDALTEEQRAVLQGAAERTREAVVAATVDDATQAKAYCEETGSVALASDEQLAAFDEAAEPIYAQLEQDPATASLIARIRELKEKTAPAPPVTACEHEPGATEASSYAGPVIPNGRYTKVTTRAEALERGLDPSIVDEMLGPDGEITVMFEIEDGRWTQYEIADTGTAQEGDLGTYSYDSDGQWVTVSESGGCRGCVGVFDWTLEDGVLRLAIVPADDAAITDDVRLITEGEFRHGS
jgi:TRAP-type C4-dicarboxylate transport system substrate-binding protein